MMLQRMLSLQRMINRRSLSVVQRLMEFFDKKENWGAKHIVHGRPWRIDEIRLKSSIDLQKLWFILLKERNMLLTMEEEYKECYELFPNPERIDKVEESMENILEVVRERDVAVNMLNEGRTKLRLPYRRYNKFGLAQVYFEQEYNVPFYLNKRWKNLWYYTKLPEWSKFYMKCRESQLARKNDSLSYRIERLVQEQLIHNPSLDVDFFRSSIQKKFRHFGKMNKSRLFRRSLPNETITNGLNSYLHDPDYKPKLIE